MEPDEARETEDWQNAELLRQYEGALRRFFGRRVRNAGEVDDLVQEAFARLIQSGDRTELQRPIAYLFRIASNLLADHARRRARQPVETELVPDELDAAIDPDQEHARHLADLQRALDQALAELSPRCRDIFVMHRFQHRSTAEIAIITGITRRAVQKQLTRALTHIYLHVHGVQQSEARDG